MSASAAQERSGRMGTFAGVFTPSILTILGIILFLRQGYVVGAGGLVQALAIVLIANGISILTSFSISAIATNLRVKAGGDYYLISRTLGVGFGGALGLVLFLSQAVSIAFYSVGFGEALGAMVGGPSWVPQAAAAVAVLGLFALAWIGSDWATRFQFVVMAILFAAIVSFFVGASETWSGELLRANLVGSADVPFWTLFAIFFPAVTGFTQGVSMSGDLKDAGRSIPLGTFLAVGLSLLVYIGVTVAFAGALPGAELASDYGAMRRLSHFGWLADAGVVAATLSSALASFLGAPRILQSLASDRVFPGLGAFAKGSGPTRNPRRGVLLAGGIALATVAFGNLNLIAPIVSMFFLISYGLLNYATYYEASGHSPSFRPRFRWFDRRLSLAGAIGCLGAMIALEPMAAAIALALLFAVYEYLRRSVRVERWADSSRSIHFQRVRENLREISNELEHPRDWRPVILVFSENPARRARILRLAGWLEGDSGLTTAVHVLLGEGPKLRRERAEAESTLRAELREHGVTAFALVVATSDLERGLPVLLQAQGLGPIKANTVCLNWFDGEDSPEGTGLRDYARHLRLAIAQGLNLAVLWATTEGFQELEARPPAQRRIDVLYLGDATGTLMLMLAYLMTRTEAWEEAPIRVLVPPSDDESPEELLARLRGHLDDVRIRAEIELLAGPDEESLVAACRGAGIAFLPLRLRDEGPKGPFGLEIGALAPSLGASVFCLAAQKLDLEAEPEGGRHGEIAEAQDAAQAAGQRAKKVEKEGDRAAGRLEEATAALAKAREEGAEAQLLAKLEGEAALAAAEQEEARRRTAKAQFKAVDTARDAEELSDVDAPTNPVAEPPEAEPDELPRDGSDGS